MGGSTRSAMAHRPPPRRVRLTRRGRAVLIVLALLMVAVAVGLAAPAAPAASHSDPTEEPDSAVAVVRPGDTLWSVAARHVPSQDPYGMIEEIRRLNDLPNHLVHPGQELRLPAR